MSGLRQIVRAAKESENLVVTPRLTTWLVQHGDEELDAKVAQRVYDLLTTKPRNRVASFSSSSAGNCVRRQVFEYVGAAGGAVPTPTLQNIFNDGKWRHLRWQAMLLMAGILTTIEYPLSWPAKRSKGSVDGHGFVPDEHPRYGGREFGFELKGANPYAWQTVDKTGAPPDKTLDQVHRYFLLSGFDLFVIVYENKATNQWLEFVVEEDPVRLQEQRVELDELNVAADHKTLPMRLPSCQQKWGDTFHQCPFGGDHGTCWKFDSSYTYWP